VVIGERADDPARRAASPGEHGHRQEHERDRTNDGDEHDREDRRGQADCLKKCSRTEPLASGERCPPPDSGVTVHSVVIAPLDTPRGCARITRCEVRTVVPAQASASVRVPTSSEERLTARS
jgi:hypothetical protein